MPKQFYTIITGEKTIKHPPKPKTDTPSYCKPCFYKDEFFPSVNHAKYKYGFSVVKQTGFVYLTKEEYEARKITTSKAVVKKPPAQVVYVTTEPAMCGIKAGRSKPCRFRDKYFPSRLAAVKKYGSAVLKHEDFEWITREQYFAQVNPKS